MQSVSRSDGRVQALGVCHECHHVRFSGFRLAIHHLVSETHAHDLIDRTTSMTVAQGSCLHGTSNNTWKGYYGNLGISESERVLRRYPGRIGIWILRLACCGSHVYYGTNNEAACREGF
jgi:hypothetical protein